MSYNRLKMFLAVVCISGTMHSAQSQRPSYNNPFRHGKWGLGACPKITPMKNFDIGRLYGDQWYMIAHYSEPQLLDRHCTSVRYSDANSGSDICRVSVERSSVEYDDGEIRNTQYVMILPNETDHSVWINTLREYSI